MQLSLLPYILLLLMVFIVSFFNYFHFHITDLFRTFGIKEYIINETIPPYFQCHKSLSQKRALSWEIGPVCFGTDHAIFPISNNSDVSWIFNRTTITHCLPIRFLLLDTIFWFPHNSSYFSLNPKIKTDHFPSLDLLRHIKEPSILLDSSVGAWQFGHAFSVMMKAILEISSGIRFYHHIINMYPRSSRFSSVLLDDLFQLLNSEMKQDDFYIALYNNSLKNPLNVICFENLTVFRNTERYFHSSNDVSLFQSFIRKRFPWFSPSLDSCPPAKAAVLSRTGEGAGSRSILNFDAVEYALHTNNITSYFNITTNQKSNLEDSVRLFSSIGLLITTHSSQLKQLCFSHPSLIVIEVRPVESKKWYGWSVFSEGPDTMGVIYRSHCEHEAAQKHLCTHDICKMKGFITSNIIVNASALEIVIRETLAVQKARCNMNWV